MNHHRRRFDVPRRVCHAYRRVVVARLRVGVNQRLPLGGRPVPEVVVYDVSWNATLLERPEGDAEGSRPGKGCGDYLEAELGYHRPPGKGRCDRRVIYQPPRL